MDFASEIAGGSGKPGRPSDSAARLRMFEARAMRQYLFADPTVRIACIGDVHGRIDLLEKLGRRLEDFVGDETRRLIEIYGGDYIDRAGDPKSVVEFLIARQARTDREVVCLLGNHEYLLLSALRSDDGFLHWLSFGGVSTLLSYGVPSAEVKRNPSNARRQLCEAVPSTHIAFLKGARPLVMNMVWPIKRSDPANPTSVRAMPKHDPIRRLRKVGSIC